MSDINIIQAFEDSKIFGSLLRDQETWATWKIVLKAIFGIAMNKEELRTYRKYTGRKKPSRDPFKEVFLIIGRRGGKSFISALVVVFLAVFKNWMQYLRPGEIGYVTCLASDRKQASVVLNYIRAILELPIFKSIVINETKEEIELNNQIMIAVHTCSYRSLRGYTVVAAICDEIAFWRVEGANPAKEVLTAIRPSLATVPGSILLALSTPYSRSGPLYDAFKEKYGKDDPDVLVWRAPTKTMNPTIQERIINKALKEDYEVAQAEWMAEFRADVEAFLPPEFVENVIAPGRFELERIPEVHYKAFIDPAGGSGQDSMTLAIAHKDREKIVLDVLRERRPPFKPRAVAAEFSDLLKRYEIQKAEADRYAGSWPSEAFQEHGIIIDNSQLSASEIYLEFLPLVANGTVELLDNKRLKAQLIGLERKTRSGAKDLITHYPGGHDDLANAVAGACVKVARRPKVIPYFWSVGVDDYEREKQKKEYEEYKKLWE